MCFGHRQKEPFRVKFAAMSLSDGRYSRLRGRSTLGNGFVPRYDCAFPVRRDGNKMIRDDIKTALVSAMKSGDKDATGTIRMIQSAIKNRDIELRTASQQPEDDAMVTEVLQKMIKQRRESVEMYRQGNREELAAKEEAEIVVIERFLPRQMDEAEAKAAIASIIADTGATSMKDMGKVMAELKSRHATSIEPAKASQLVKAALSGA
jgi:uncharacterized protein YqeY